MEICPICKKIMDNKKSIPNEKVSGRYIDALHPVDICENCNNKLVLLSPKVYGVSQEEKAEAKKYLNQCLSHVENINFAAILDLYVNFDDKPVEQAILETARETYKEYIKKCNMSYKDFDHVFTPGGAFGLDGNCFVYTLYEDISDETAFEQMVHNLFVRSLQLYEEGIDKNIIEYAIDMTNRALVNNSFESHSTEINLIDCYKIEGDTICLKCANRNYLFSMACLPAFEQLIPEKEDGFYEQMLEEYEQENDLEETFAELDAEIDKDIEDCDDNAVAPERSTQDAAESKVYVMPQFVDENLVRLRQLKELYDMGAVTEAEFIKKKKQFLD